MSEQRVADIWCWWTLMRLWWAPGRPKRPVDMTFCTYDQDQPMLLAPDVRDWLAAEHRARWVDALVEDGLDLSPICDDDTEVGGGPLYDPRLMVKRVFYGYFHGSRPHGRVSGAATTTSRSGSSLRSRRRTLWRSVSSRAWHAQAFKELFTQSLALCAQAGLVCLGSGRVGLDGFEDPGLGQSAPGDK